MSDERVEPFEIQIDNWPYTGTLTVRGEGPYTYCVEYGNSQKTTDQSFEDLPSLREHAALDLRHLVYEFLHGPTPPYY